MWKFLVETLMLTKVRPGDGAEHMENGEWHGLVGV